MANQTGPTSCWPVVSLSGLPATTTPTRSATPCIRTQGTSSRDCRLSLGNGGPARNHAVGTWRFASRWFPNPRRSSGIAGVPRLPRDDLDAAAVRSAGAVTAEGFDTTDVAVHRRCRQRNQADRQVPGGPKTGHPSLASRLLPRYLSKRRLSIARDCFAT